MSRENAPKRKYELKKRAKEMAETHQRITEAAIELHGTLGPSRTTMSAVAKQAGVERRTLYRHFPTETALFEACSTHYFAANPWPDPTAWCAIPDPRERLERALDQRRRAIGRCEAGDRTSRGRSHATGPLSYAPCERRLSGDSGSTCSCPVAGMSG